MNVDSSGAVDSCLAMMAQSLFADRILETVRKLGTASSALVVVNVVCRAGERERGVVT